MIYEAVDRPSGTVWAAFEAPQDERAAKRWRLETKLEGLDPEPFKLRRAPNPSLYPHIGTAEIDWFPKEQVSHG